ncbi:MAG: hypothetical protein HOO93_02395 [Methyloglobulus sp.]|nr:hypothetical protein [Methyloglobulus sp.]
MIETKTIPFPRSTSRKMESLPRMTLSEPNVVWRDKVTRRLEELIRLENGWDGYQGLPVSFENAAFALRMLETISSWNTEAPQIVPGYSGDLQVEWHTLNGDLELHVERPNKVNAWYWNVNDKSISDGEELLLKNDFSKVAEWIKVITESQLGSKAAAA